jgi:hypothetical protein
MSLYYFLIGLPISFMLHSKKKVSSFCSFSSFLSHYLPSMAETEINGGSIGRPNIQQNDIINQHDPMRPRKIIGSYVMTKTLGRGSMGKVKLATNIETNKKVCYCKRIKLFID